LEDLLMLLLFECRGISRRSAHDTSLACGGGAAGLEYCIYIQYLAVEATHAGR